MVYASPEDVISQIIRAGSISQITEISKFLNHPSFVEKSGEVHSVLTEPQKKLEQIQADLIKMPTVTHTDLHEMHEALNNVHMAVQRAKNSEVQSEGKLSSQVKAEVSDALINNEDLKIPDSLNQADS